MKRFPKRVLVLFVVLVGAALLAGCGGQATPPQSSSAGNTANTAKAPEAPKFTTIEKGVLTVGSDVSYPPQEFFDEKTHEAVGFDIDVAKAIADKLGLKLKVVNVGFDGIIPALNAKRFDLLISAMTITPERSKTVKFIPYFNAGQSILVLKGNPEKIQSLDDLSGKTVAVELGTAEVDTLKAENAKLTKAGKKPIIIKTFEKDTEAVKQLELKRVSAAMNDSPVAGYYTKQAPDKFELAGQPVEMAPEGMALRLDDTALYTAVKEAFDQIVKDGTYQKLLDKWGLPAASGNF